MKRETVTRAARAVWRAGFAAAGLSALPLALLCSLGLARSTAAGALCVVALAGCAAAAIAGAILGDDF